tara:strand:+ start:2850 stop:3332 length:483 start_codon:yes stop_codon:yes gene_type:complete
MTYLEQRRKFIEDGRPLKEKKKYSIPKKSAKRIEKEKSSSVVKEKENLEMWFKDIQMKHFTEFGGSCMECGSHIPLKYARHSTAHLLPKKLFKSVACHPLNFLVLGAGCGCHALTDRVDKFVGMKIWPEAAKRLKTIIPLLPFDELKYLSGQLMTALENT